MSEDQSQNSGDEARVANEQILNGYWCKAMESLVGSGVPWKEAAASMLSVAALQVEAAMGLDAAERSLNGAAGYMATKREASERLDKIASSKLRH